MKRKLKDVATEYAKEVLRQRLKRTKSEHVLEVLRRQHDGHSVAFNLGTRPNIIRPMQSAMGNAKYEALAVSSSSPAPNVPCIVRPPDAPGVDDFSMPSLAKLTSRFPADASALLSEGAQRIAVLNPEEVKFLMSELADGNVATENA